MLFKGERLEEWDPGRNKDLEELMMNESSTSIRKEKITLDRFKSGEISMSEFFRILIDN